MNSKAFIFDLNGTMVDDMAYHTRAWYDILNNDLSADLGWNEVEKEMYGKNQELLVRVFGAEKLTAAEMDNLSLEKEKRYQSAYKPYLKLINGLHEFLKKAHEEKVKLAIGSAAIRYNIDFVLDGTDARHYFSSIVSADDVDKSKPHPETFLKAAAQLQVDPKDCIVFEDAPKGVEAAANAGMQAVVIITMHAEEQFKKYNNVLLFIKDYTDKELQRLL